MADDSELFIFGDDFDAILDALEDDDAIQEEFNDAVVQMTSTQLPGITELSSAFQLNKLSVIDGVNHVFQVQNPFLLEPTIDSPLPSLQSWYPSLMTQDVVGLRYIAQSEPLVYTGSVAPSVFLSSATDRNFECVLDMEGQTIDDDQNPTEGIEDVKCELEEITSEHDDDDNDNDAKSKENNSAAEQIANAVIRTDLGAYINLGQNFSFENVIANATAVDVVPKKKRKMVTTVATQTPPENSVYDDIEPVRLPVRYLYEFLELLLADERYRKLIVWKNKEERVFMLIDHHKVAEMWGMHKRKKPMTYDKFSRALRFYYSKNILKKEPGRFTYKFLIKEGEFVQYMK